MRWSASARHSVWLTAAVARYDTIGQGYGMRRREDPRIAAAVWEALGPVRSVVNVGAGVGSYEPAGCEVIPVEPSEVMVAQRESTLAPAIVGRAEALPLTDKSVDAAVAILSLHHWEDQEAGMAELVRVARQRIVILTVDPEVSGRMWLMAEYLTEVAALDREIFPPTDAIARRLGGRVQVVPVPADCEDGFLLAFWAHPEWVLDPAARAATSGFARMSEEVNRRVADDVARDLASGAWDSRHGQLRALSSYDAGLRLVVADLPG